MRVLAAPVAAPGDRPGGEVVPGLDGLVGRPGLDRERDVDTPFRGRELTGVDLWIDLKKAERMSGNDRKDSGTGNRPGENPGAARRPRSIRFSDSEWNLIERAAARHGIPAGELVRAGALALAEDRLGESPPETLSPGHLALIETTCRMVYVLATLNRDRMLDARREKELDDIVSAAHRVMAETMEDGSA